MYCSKCGTQLADDAAFCPTCGRPIQPSARPSPPAPTPVSPAPPAHTPSYTPPVPQQPAPYGWQTARPHIAYAGFWLRFVAYIIDSLILGAVVGVGIFLPFLGGTLRTFGGDNPWQLYTSMARPLVAIRLLGLMAGWIYYALMESSGWQATLGKKVLGLKVTDLAGNRISFARASGRFFGKILSGMLLLVGFMMAGFTERKQALHDILAGCLVLRQL
ncbi:MAG: RDD family protein [Candidatus Acidiferrales bacterium]